MPLTGGFDFRRTLGGKIVLQVEEDARVWWFGFLPDGRARNNLEGHLRLDCEIRTFVATG
jgi:hypothetical protein